MNWWIVHVALPLEVVKHQLPLYTNGRTHLLYDNKSKMSYYLEFSMTSSTSLRWSNNLHTIWNPNSHYNILFYYKWIQKRDNIYKPHYFSLGLTQQLVPNILPHGLESHSQHTSFVYWNLHPKKKKKIQVLCGANASSNSYGYYYCGPHQIKLPPTTGSATVAYNESSSVTTYTYLIFNIIQYNNNIPSIDT